MWKILNLSKQSNLCASNSLINFVLIAKSHNAILYFCKCRFKIPLSFSVLNASAKKNPLVAIKCSLQFAQQN